MGNLLGSAKDQYDDNGSLMVSQYGVMGSASFSGNADQGSILAAYDGSLTTYFYFHVNRSSNSTSHLTWDFKSKMKFKNIIAYVGGDDLQYIKLQGSNDYATWTDLASTGGIGSTTTNFQLTAANIAYRYIRIYVLNSASDWGNAMLYEIRAVI